MFRVSKQELAFSLHRVKELIDREGYLAVLLNECVEAYQKKYPQCLVSKLINVIDEVDIEDAVDKIAEAIPHLFELTDLIDHFPIVLKFAIVDKIDFTAFIPEEEESQINNKQICIIDRYFTV